MGQEWTAIAYSRSIAGELFESGMGFRMQSVHQQACNLVSARGNLVTLAAPALGNGPFHVTVPADLFAAVTLSDQFINPTGKRLMWRDYELDLSVAELWSPVVHWPRNQLNRSVCDHLTAVADELCPFNLFCPAGGASSLAWEQLRRRLDDGIAALQMGFRSGGMEHVYAGARALGGLGPGLTPAGDDLLVGAMAGLWLMQECFPSATLLQQKDAARCCQLIGDTTIPQTTQLSGLWLTFAMQNHFSEPWHRVANSLASNDIKEVRTAVSSLMSVGATSGSAAFFGFVLAISVIANGSNVIEK